MRDRQYYRNVFLELGKTEEEIAERLEQIADFVCSRHRLYRSLLSSSPFL